MTGNTTGPAWSTHGGGRFGSGFEGRGWEKKLFLIVLSQVNAAHKWLYRFSSTLLASAAPFKIRGASLQSVSEILWEKAALHPYLLLWAVWFQFLRSYLSTITFLPSRMCWCQSLPLPCVPFSFPCGLSFKKYCCFSEFLERCGESYVFSLPRLIGIPGIYFKEK